MTKVSNNWNQLALAGADQLNPTAPGRIQGSGGLDPKLRSWNVGVNALGKGSRRG